MATQVRRSVQLGELVVAAFDEAAQFGSDSEEVSRLAMRALRNILRRAKPSAKTQRRNR